MSDSVRPHRRQPTRLPHPWDSPGKNTGLGCHFLLQCMKIKSESKVAQSCPTHHDPRTAAYQSPPPTGFSRQEYWSGLPLPSLKIPLSITKLLSFSLLFFSELVFLAYLRENTYTFNFGSHAKKLTLSKAESFYSFYLKESEENYLAFLRIYG